MFYARVQMTEEKSLFSSHYCKEKRDQYVSEVNAQLDEMRDSASSNIPDCAIASAIAKSDVPKKDRKFLSEIRYSFN